MPRTNLSNDQKINALLTGFQWGTRNGQGITVTYSFPTGKNSRWDDYTQFEEIGTASALNNVQQQNFRQALNAWSQVANIKFVEVQDTNQGVGKIRVAFSELVSDNNSDAWAYAPAENAEFSHHGDIWLDPEQTDYSLGSYGYNTLLHEIGHAIGLKHSFEANKINSQILSESFDNHQFTTMSYTEYAGAGYQYGNYYEIHATQPSSPMILDIAAIQFLYGANNNHATDNNVYKFSNTEAELQTIWDAGGTDSIDASNQLKDVRIDLHAGQFSSIGIQQLGFNPNQAFVAAQDNIAIALNVTIENAIGGAGDDVILGNGRANILQGNQGNDLLLGFKGNDILRGYAGKDILYGDKGNDIVAGGNRNDILYGNKGKDKLLGGNGNDILIGGADQDILIGGNGADIFKFNSLIGVDKIQDFVISVDTLQFENNIFSALGKKGNLATRKFIAGKGFNQAQDSNDYLIYNRKTGALFYDADANGDLAAEKIALLGVNLNLTADDFTII